MFQRFFMTLLIGLALVAFGCVEKKQSIDELNEELKGLGVKLEKVDPKEIKKEGKKK